MEAGQPGQSLDDGDDASVNLVLEADTASRSTATATATIGLCRDQVETYMADKAILFASGSVRVTAESVTVVQGLAPIFSLCPAAPIYVEGHTDSDGSDALNLILSVSRAEAVVNLLADFGVSRDRMYAIGYGAGLPIASNDTAAGKALNRRIVFRFEDIAEEARP